MTRTYIELKGLPPRQESNLAVLQDGDIPLFRVRNADLVPASSPWSMTTFTGWAARHLHVDNLLEPIHSAQRLRVDLSDATVLAAKLFAEDFMDDANFQSLVDFVGVHYGSLLNDGRSELIKIAITDCTNLLDGGLNLFWFLGSCFWGGLRFFFCAFFFSSLSGVSSRKAAASIEIDDSLIGQGCRSNFLISFWPLTFQFHILVLNGSD